MASHLNKFEFASPKCFWANGPVGKKVNIEKIYNDTNNGKEKERTVFDQDSGPRFDLD